MQLSRSTNVWKRLAWLWGALLGVVLLPVMMEACYYGAVLELPPPSGVRVTVPFFTLFSNLPMSIGHNGLWCAGLGCCGAMLWAGHRSWKWRSLSLLVAVGTMSYLGRQFWQFLDYWPTNTAMVAQWHSWNRWSRYVFGAEVAPLLLAALLLFFFALLLRSLRPQTA